MVKLSKKIDKTGKNLIWPLFEDDLINLEPFQTLDNLEDVVLKTPGEITKVFPLGRLPFETVYFLGLGSKSSFDYSKYQEWLGKIFTSISDDTIINLNHLDLDCHQLTYVTVESYLLSTYRFIKINANAEKTYDLQVWLNKDVEKDYQQAIINGESVNHARDLANMPSNLMKPVDLAKYAEELAEKYQLGCTIFDNKELKKLGANAILAVNQGSKEEARMIVLDYHHNGDAPYTALIGKGLTYDSGGYNLKTTGGAGMKYDMCGAANVLGAIEIIARSKYPANVYAIIPATENLINGGGYKADDVIVSLSKKTIEVTNTDAEGRLVLCDAITYACQLGAKRIIDIATLTGAICAALGAEYSGGFTNNQDFYDEFIKTTKRYYEPVWQMPVNDGYANLLKKSMVADLVNSVKNRGDACIAACFLQEFLTDNVEWIHLDIAYTSTTDGENPLYPKGASGVMVRSMAGIFQK